MKKTKFNPEYFFFDWKDSPDDVFESLKPFLKKFGIHMIEDPNTIDSDTIGYILTDNPKMTIGEWKISLKRMGDDCAGEWIDEIKESHNITDKDTLQKLVNKLQ